jgi:hypothetical protein
MFYTSKIYDCILGECGSDEINEGFGSDRILAGSVDDRIELEGTGAE